MQLFSGALLIRETIEDRAKKTLTEFFKDKFSGLNFCLKTRYFMTKVMRIQEQLKKHKENNKIRMELLEIKFKEQLGKY